MLELLNQLDGFEATKNIKVVMATNRIDILDSALLRPGRIDRKIEFPPPNEEVRQRILYYCFSFCLLWPLSVSRFFLFLKMYLHVEFTSQFLLNWLCFTGKIGHPEDSLEKDEFNKRHKPQKNCWTHAWLIRSWSEGTVYYIDDQETDFFFCKNIRLQAEPPIL